MTSILKAALLGKFKRLSKPKLLKQLSDEELMREFVSGCCYSYELLVERYKKRVFEFIYFQIKQNAQDAEDLTQEVFIQLYRKPENFRAKSKFSSYVFAIAKNIMLNYFRTISRRIKPSESDGAIDIIDDSCLQLQMINNKQQQQYIDAFNQLKVDEQQIIYLADKECFSYLQIGDILDIKIGTVRSRLSSARAKIYNQLRAQLDEM